MDRCRENGKKMEITMSGVGFGAQSFGLIVCSLRIGDLGLRVQGLGFKV